MMRRMLLGALAGGNAAAAMLPLRLLARRAGLIDKTVPQAMEEWASERTGLEPPGGAAGHHALDQALHVGYGMAGGALYALALHGRGRTAWRGPLFGLGVWAFGFLALVPALGAHRPAWRAAAAENAVNVLSHLAYGAIVALMLEEMSRQPDHRATSDAERRRTRVG